MTLNTDIAPTVLDLAGLALPAEMSGRSWRPLLEGSETHWREDCLFDHMAESTDIRSQLAVRTNRYKLITYPRLTRVELYDLEHDPSEMRNVAEDPTYAGIRSELETRLDRLVKETDWRCYNPHPVHRCLALGPVSEADVPRIERALLYEPFTPDKPEFTVGGKTFTWQTFEAQPNTNFALEEQFGYGNGEYVFMAIPIERLVDQDPFCILRYTPFRPIKAYENGQPVLECSQPGWQATLNPVLTERETIVVVRFKLEGHPTVQLHLFAPDGAVATRS